MSLVPASQTARPKTRRRIGRRARSLVVALALSLCAVFVTMSGASAGLAWCRTDPIAIINGNIADVFVASTLAAPLKVTGPTQVVITVPQDAHALVIPDLGFLHGEKVTVVHSDALHMTPKGMQLSIAVYVPAKDSSLPVEVDFAPRILGILNPATASGTANQWITLDVLF
jgi:hypothetical protein